MASKWGMQIGGQVDIKRSDGRVHPAVVSGFNEATRSVTVEWFENQETKGKELDLQHLAALNTVVYNALHNKEGGRKAGGHSMLSPPVDGGVPARRQTVQSRETPRDKENERVKAARPSAKIKEGKGKEDKAFNNIQEIAQKREQRRAQQEKQAAKREVAKANKGANPNFEFQEMVNDFRDGQVIHPGIPPGMTPSDRKITVCVRKRPLGRKEVEACDVDVTTIPDGENMLLHECKLKVDLTKYLEHHEFRFDHSFDDTVPNAEVYKYTAQPLVRTIFDKGMATCFAYGQTGSGKTFTMMGVFKEGARTPDSSSGIYAMAAADVFRYNELPVHKAKGLTVSVSFFEIYGGKVFDLMNNRKRLRVLEDGKQQVNVVGLSEKVVTCLPDVLRELQAGTEVRASGTTSANENSSRSHAVFQILLREGKKKRLHGKFSLIDLAGNERGADTASASRQVRMEGAEINKSLLALKECIRALSMKSKHTPYRASKLTQVLRDSFIGANARTCMIAMVSPGLSSCENSLNTLRYADRVKELKKGGKAPRASARPPVQPGEPDMVPTESPMANLDEVEDDDSSDANWLTEPSPLESSLARQDLKMLHESLKIKDQDQNPNLFSFDVAVAEVLEQGEKVEAEHAACLQFERDMLLEEDRLLEDINSVDYDVEDYARRLQEIVQAKIEKLNALQESVTDFRAHLRQEEEIAKKVSSSPGVRY